MNVNPNKFLPNVSRIISLYKCVYALLNIHEHCPYIAIMFQVLIYLFIFISNHSSQLFLSTNVLLCNKSTTRFSHLVAHIKFEQFLCFRNSHISLHLSLSVVALTTLLVCLSAPNPEEQVIVVHRPFTIAPLVGTTLEARQELREGQLGLPFGSILASSYLEKFRFQCFQRA